MAADFHSRGNSNVCNKRLSNKCDWWCNDVHTQLKNNGSRVSKPADLWVSSLSNSLSTSLSLQRKREVVRGRWVVVYCCAQNPEGQDRRKGIVCFCQDFIKPWQFDQKQLCSPHIWHWVNGKITFFPMIFTTCQNRLRSELHFKNRSQ